MKKKLLSTLLVICTGAASAADTASWATWSSVASGSFTQNASTVTVTYTGEGSLDLASYVFDQPASFTNAAVTNTPGGNGSIHMVGGTSDIKTFHFSQAVIDPLVAVWSVGQNGLPVSFNFLNNPAFSILAQGSGHWGGGTLTQSGPSVTGEEGNGLLQFIGSYTDIAFTTPNYENYYGITVGALITAVPEPETYAMMLAGLGLLGFASRRRKAS